MCLTIQAICTTMTPEAVVARHMSIPLLAVGLVWDSLVASACPSISQVSHSEEAKRVSLEHFGKLLAAVVQKIYTVQKCEQEGSVIGN